MWQDNTSLYGASSSQYYPQNAAPQQGVPLQFYAPSPVGSTFYPGSRSSLEGNVGAQGSIAQQGVPPGYGGNIQPAGGWWTAFGTGGFEGEPPLLEELGINFSHIRAKSLAVLNPLGRVDEHIMDDADLAGPLLFFFCFGTFLLFGIDAYRVVSVLGYCLLPMVGVGALSVMVTLDGMLGYVLSTLSILWCTYAALGIFVAVLRMSDQRLLVAYPVGLLYGCFALLSVFNVGVGGSGSAK
ncbi:Protein YIPF5 [Grifola frondosa]|uniref:Protein YIPF5 n=1 Tax=Grifola frondosa TaxID=5627 RepID=A0A1C7LUS9_GRIFR|nr:Protein YIPF5 [Grifola frondosa]